MSMLNSILTATLCNARRVAPAAALPLLLAGTMALLSPVAHAQTIANFSFETPAQGGGFTYNPSGAGVGWTFTGNSGISGNGTGFTSGNANAPDGVQVAFVQGIGSFSQSISGFSAGTYAFSFVSSQRQTGSAGPNPAVQTLSVTVDGTSVGSFTPLSALTTYQAFTTTPIALTAGSHTLQFAGTVSTGDNTALVDKVTVSAAAPEPSAMLLLAPGALGMVGMIVRRHKAA